MLGLLRISITFVWQDTLTSTKHISCVIRTTRLLHLHIVGANLCVTLNNNGAKSTSFRFCWQTSCGIDRIFSNCGYLTTAIDTLLNPGVTLNGNCTVTTYQSRVAMRFLTTTGTEYITFDNGCFCTTFFAISESYRHHRILFHTANLTATIDVAFHRAVADNDVCSAIAVIGIFAFAINTNHGFCTFE